MGVKSVHEAIEAIKEDPTDMSKVYGFLPPSFAEKLRSELFSGQCTEIFTDATTTDELAFVDAFPLVFEIASTIDVQPAIIVSTTKMSQAAIAWNVFVEFVKVEEFPAF